MSPHAFRMSRILAAVALLNSLAVGQLLFGPGTVSNLSPSTTFMPCDVADVDADGKPDLVTSLNGVIRWHQGDGAGSFSITGTIVSNVSGIEIHLADLDGDGRKDLIAGSTITDLIQVALAEGTGFVRPTDYALNPQSVAGMSLASGDADADGDVDVLAVCRGPLGFPGEARLFLNDGTGALTVGPIVPGDAEHIVIGGLTGSLDGDNLPDLIVVTQFNSLHTSTAWLGQPGGGVQASWSMVGKEGAARIADLDADGDADILAHTAYLMQPVVVASHLGAGDGTFSPGPVTALGLTIFSSVTADVADFDADGVPDLLVSVPGAPPEAWMLRGDGGGSYAMPGARVSMLASLAPSAFAQVGPFADFDLDGRIDVSCAVNPPNQTSFMVSLNETYPPDGALLDLGHQLKGVTGYPIQVVSGSFVGGTGFSFSLAKGPVSGSVFHVLGFSTIYAPFKGGTMVPMPNLLSGPWPTTSGGTLSIVGHWPMGVPAGFEIAAQFWFASPGAPSGFAASSAVLITTP